MNEETSDKQLEINNLRHEAVSSSNDIDQIKKSIESLIANFDTNGSLNQKTRERIERFSEMILDLNDTFKQVTDPLMEFICRNPSTTLTTTSSTDSVHSDTNSRKSSTNHVGSNNSCDSKTLMSTVFITNLNEFMSEPIIWEYLRQQGILVSDCKQVPGYNERSRNFKVLIKSCDVNLILDQNLWPKGVVTSIRDPVNQEYKKLVHGSREIDLPGIVISPGMSYWHDV